MVKSSAEDCGPFLKALADKTRWGIVQELLSRQLPVNELAERLKVSPYNVSKHLRILRDVGIVTTTRKGKHIHCAIVPAFQHRAANNENRLDLGCCIFRFERKYC
jgi:DNA-binding transcriptional ArsR family regulator